MSVFNSVLDKMNMVIGMIVGFAFMFQLVYLFLFWLPLKRYPEAKEKHKVGVIVCARNEKAVIARIIKNLQELNYPKDKYEIIVMADNCTDETADIARSLNGNNDIVVKVFERHEPDRKKHNVGWALNYLFEQMKNDIDNYEFFVRFDADAMVDKEYLNVMNNAFEGGAKAAKGYNHAANLTQNVTAGVSGLWYIRDCRFNCHARAGLHTDVFMVGCGMMFSADIIKQAGGWHSTSTSEDTEFTIHCLKTKNKVRYCPDAIVYDDQPSSIKDLFHRNVRMGHSLHKLFWTQGWQCLGRFFTSFRYCWLDMFLNLFFLPIAVLCCVWFPLYYVYQFIYCGVVGDIATLMYHLWFIGILIGFAFLIPFIAQAFLVCLLERKKLGVPFKKVFWSCMCFPMFMIIWAIGIVWGVFTKQKWKQPKRNVDFNANVEQPKEAEIKVTTAEIEAPEEIPAVEVETKKPTLKQKKIAKLAQNDDVIDMDLRR